MKFFNNLLNRGKKHVLFIVENSYIPGDIRVWREAQTVTDWGYEVTIISPKSKYTARAHEELKGINVYRYSSLNSSKSKWAFIYEYINALFQQFFLAIRIYINKPFKIIHAANPPDTIIIVFLFFKLLGTKYIFDLHDLSPELYITKFSGKKDIVYKILILLEKISCKMADAIISTNESYKKIIQYRHKINPGKIFIVRNDPMINENLLRNKPKYRREEENKIVLLYLGTINLQDGVDILIQALYYLVNKLTRNDFICNIVGEGDSLLSVKQTVNELHLNHFIDFKGYIHDRERIKEYLYLSDICVEPAPDSELNKYSTFIKIMEYMAFAKPIVVFDLLESRYSANGSAIFVKPGDIIGFAKAINKLIDDSQLREKLGKFGLKKIKNELNWEIASQNLWKVYDSFAL